MCLCFGLGPVPWIFAKLLKIPHCRFETDSNQNNNLSGRHVADEIDCKRSRNSQGYIDFSIAESGLTNPQKSVLVPLQKIELLGLEIDSVRMTLPLPQEKVKKLRLKCQKLISNPRTTLWEMTSLLGFLCSTTQAVLPAMLQIRFLQQQQIVAIRNNYSYQSTMYLNQDSIQELQWWFNNLEICNGNLIVSPTSKTVIQSDASKKGWGRIVRKCQQGVIGLSRSQNSLSMFWNC